MGLIRVLAYRQAGIGPWLSTFINQLICGSKMRAGGTVGKTVQRMVGRFQRMGRGQQNLKPEIVFLISEIRLYCKPIGLCKSHFPPPHRLRRLVGGVGALGLCPKPHFAQNHLVYTVLSAKYNQISSSSFVVEGAPLIPNISPTTSSLFPRLIGILFALISSILPNTDCTFSFDTI